MSGRRARQVRAIKAFMRERAARRAARGPLSPAMQLDFTTRRTTPLTLDDIRKVRDEIFHRTEWEQPTT